MKLFPVLVFLVAADLSGAVPTQCLSCGLGSFDAANCIRFQEDQTCATGEESLGTTHCGTAAIKYVDYGTNVTRTGIFRGCFDCSDKTAACFAIGGFLRPRGRTVLQCEIECCSSSKCNTQFPSLSLNAVTVFSPNAPGGTKQCQSCRGGNPYQCSYQKKPEICATDFGSLGTTHCGSAIIKYREQRGGRISQGVLRGCINCADKKIACAAIRGGIKTQFGTLLECEIECCTGDNCNEDTIDTGPGQCIKCANSQFGPLTACGSSEQWNQSCLIDSSSLGASHCGSAAIKYRDFSDETIKTDVIRGCFNCSDKKAACLTLGGYLKTFRVTLLECDIECCNSSNCNTQKLSLTQDAVRVFPPAASVPSRCQQCFEDNETECIQRQQLRDCGPDSLGTTHCGFAKITFWFSFSIRSAVYKGCINCADKKAACAVLSGYVKSRRGGVIILACNIQCNEPAAGQRTCIHCLNSCSNKDGPVTCSANEPSSGSLGTPFCGSVIGRYRDASGNERALAHRGCFNCADKKAACFDLGGYMKASSRTLLECELDCCTGNNCNTQIPTGLPSAKAIKVFTPSASGPKQCYVCLEDDEASCSKRQETKICATDPYSLGTSHCGTAVGKYRDSKGNIVDAFVRGCINCADKKAACAAVGGLMRGIRSWTAQLECEATCCTDDDCNKDTIPSGDSKKTSGVSGGHHILSTVLLVSSITLSILRKD